MTKPIQINFASLAVEDPEKCIEFDHAYFTTQMLRRMKMQHPDYTCPYRTDDFYKTLFSLRSAMENGLRNVDQQLRSDSKGNLDHQFRSPKAFEELVSIANMCMMMAARIGDIDLIPMYDTEVNR